MTEYNESVSGFKLTGKWSEIVKHGEMIAFALEELNSDSHLGFEKELTEYNDWRPKLSENVKTDINNKTADKATISENKREKEANKPQQDIKKAGEKAIGSYKDLNEPEEAVKDWRESADYATRAAIVAARKSIRKVEKTIYKNLMTVVSPYYFDNNLVSANLNRVQKNPHIYKLEININEDNIKSDVSNKLKKYNDTYDRWHVSANKNVDDHKLVEGSDDVTDESNVELNSEPTCT